MKVINSGNRYEIYNDDLKTYDKLPSKTYKVTFNPMSGYSLIKVDDFEHQPGRIFRIKGEAYWDRDTGKLKEQDISIPEEKNFYDDWASKILKKKMQCHYPITLFGAK